MLLAIFPLAVVAATIRIRVHAPADSVSRDTALLNTAKLASYACGLLVRMATPAVGALVFDPLAFKRAAIGPRVNLCRAAA